MKKTVRLSLLALGVAGWIWIGVLAGIAWERHGRFVCPPEYNCLIGKNGNSVLIERSIAIAPTTGRMGIVGR